MAYLKSDQVGPGQHVELQTPNGHLRAYGAAEGPPAVPAAPEPESDPTLWRELAFFLSEEDYGLARVPFISWAQDDGPVFAVVFEAPGLPPGIAFAGLTVDTDPSTAAPFLSVAVQAVKPNAPRSFTVRARILRVS